MRYLRLTPYIWMVWVEAPYDRCIVDCVFIIGNKDLLGQVCPLVVPKSYQGLSKKSSRKVSLGVLQECWYITPNPQLEDRIVEGDDHAININ